MRRRGVFRGWAILWAVLQFALPPVAMVADARLEGASAGGRDAHVESASSADCAPMHAVGCALCHFLSQAAGPLSVSNALIAPSVQALVRARGAQQGPAAWPRRTSLARAPPLS